MQLQIEREVDQHQRVKVTRDEKRTADVFGTGEKLDGLVSGLWSEISLILGSEESKMRRNKQSSMGRQAKHCIRDLSMRQNGSSRERRSQKHT